MSDRYELLPDLTPFRTSAGQVDRTWERNKSETAHSRICSTRLLEDTTHFAVELRMPESEIRVANNGIVKKKLFGIGICT